MTRILSHTFPEIPKGLGRCTASETFITLHGFIFAHERTDEKCQHTDGDHHADTHDRADFADVAEHRQAEEVADKGINGIH